MKLKIKLSGDRQVILVMGDPDENGILRPTMTVQFVKDMVALMKKEGLDVEVTA
jgi:hypothetical protein